MTKRWNTYRIAGWGVLFGVLYSATRQTFEQGWPTDDEGLVYLISYIGGGAVGGAGLFAIISGVRNLVLHAR